MGPPFLSVYEKQRTFLKRPSWTLSGTVDLGLALVEGTKGRAGGKPPSGEATSRAFKGALPDLAFESVLTLLFAPKGFEGREEIGMPYSEL